MALVMGGASMVASVGGVALTGSGASVASEGGGDSIIAASTGGGASVVTRLNIDSQSSSKPATSLAKSTAITTVSSSADSDCSGSMQRCIDRTCMSSAGVHTKDDLP